MSVNHRADDHDTSVQAAEMHGHGTRETLTTDEGKDKYETILQAETINGGDTGHEHAA